MDIIDMQKYIFGSLFLLSSKLQVIGDQYLSEANMTTRQWFLTAIISQFGDASPTLGEVAKLMGSSHQNVKQLAMKLQEKGFLQIKKDELDGRIIRLKLTEKSRSFWEKRAEDDRRFITELFKELSEAETNIMYKSINMLFDKIDKMSNKKI